MGSPAAPRGAGLSARRLAKSEGAVENRTYQNIEAYGWSEKEIGPKLFDIVPKLHCPQATKWPPMQGLSHDKNCLAE